MVKGLNFYIKGCDLWIKIEKRLILKRIIFTLLPKAKYNDNN